MAAAAFTNTAATLIYDRLVVQDADRSFHPHLAESWEEAPDGMSWTFRLRENVTFHNGVPLTAQAVADWIALFSETDNAYMTAAIAAVEVLDERTVRFVMGNPEPNLLYNLASSFMGVMEPGAVRALGERYRVTEAVGTGPFRLERFEIGQETVLVRNEDYTWGPALAANRGPAKLARLNFREIAEEATAFLELQSGGVHALLSVPVDLADQITAQPGLALITLPGQELVYFVMNVTKEPFTDIRVREAAARAIDQAEIAATLYRGVGAPATTFLILSLPEAAVDPALRITHDRARAEALLDAAGWTRGADGVRVKDGQRLRVDLWTQSDTAFRRLTEVVQAQLAAVGFEASITLFDAAVIRDEYRSDVHQAAVRSYFWDNADILDWFFGADRLGYPNVSMLVDEAAEAPRRAAMSGSANAAERERNFIAYHEYILSLFPFAPIHEPPILVAYDTRRLIVPEVIRAPTMQGHVFLDMALAE